MCAFILKNAFLLGNSLLPSIPQANEDSAGERTEA